MVSAYAESSSESSLYLQKYVPIHLKIPSEVKYKLQEKTQKKTLVYKYIRRSELDGESIPHYEIANSKKVCKR